MRCCARALGHHHVPCNPGYPYTADRPSLARDDSHASKLLTFRARARRRRMELERENAALAEKKERERLKTIVGLQPRRTVHAVGTKSSPSSSTSSSSSTLTAARAIPTTTKASDTYTTSSSEYGRFSASPPSFMAAVPRARRTSKEGRDTLGAAGLDTKVKSVRERLRERRASAERAASGSGAGSGAAAGSSSAVIGSSTRLSGAGAGPGACVGLSNLGNTCFMNSTLQCLFGVREILDYFCEATKERSSLREKVGMGGTKGAIAPAFGDLVRRVRTASKASVVTPSAFLDRIKARDRKWGGMRQHDSQEFLQFLLNGLREECNRVESKPKYRELEGKGTEAEQAGEALRYFKSWHDSIIDDIFGGMLESSIQCLSCGHVSYCFDPFLDLSVPVPGKVTTSVHDCLAKFTEKERLDKHEGYKCERCKETGAANKKLVIYAPPPVLILHLKRFSGGGLSRFSSRLSKNAARVGFDSVLDLGEYCGNEAAKRGAKYALFGVSNHSGSMSGGHYYADVKNAFDGQWYNFNDSMVSGTEEPTSGSAAAYVLFYRRIDKGG